MANRWWMDVSERKTQLFATTGIYSNSPFSSSVLNYAIPQILILYGLRQESGGKTI